MELKAPTAQDAEEVRLWRNQVLATLRTPYQLTGEMQADYYKNVICNRQTNSRWWSVYSAGALVGFTGLTGIEWENGLAEISLIIKPDVRGSGYGKQTVKLVLDEAFGNMGLKTVYGECYMCNPAVEFWKKVTEEYGGNYTTIPRRKFWRGKLYDALHFSIWR